MHLSMVGTRGVPARYGGFETAVEEIGSRLVARGHEVTVYCRSDSADHEESYLGMRLVHVPAARHRALETLSRSTLAALHHSTRRHPPDVALVFNAANAVVIPVFKARNTPVILHMDGLEWQRGKWGRMGRAYYLHAERLGVRLADRIIADARGIQRYYFDVHGRTAEFIPYGAPDPHPAPVERLCELGLTPHNYLLVVARVEPENHVLEVITAYSKSAVDLPLVVVGGNPYGTRYGDEVTRAAGRDPRILMTGPMWDQELLDRLYCSCAQYLHGHSVGGTNPSLLRAMGASAPVTALDVTFNREVLGDTGRYFTLSPEITSEMMGFSSSQSWREDERDRGRRGRDRALALYSWDDVTERYERLCFQVASHQPSVPARHAWRRA